MSLLLGVSLALTTVSARGFIWPNTIEQIERDLVSKDVGTRRSAARRLTEVPDATAAKLVLEAMNDTDAQVRLAAVEAAAQLRLKAASERVIPWLNDSERSLRLAAAELLRQAPDRRAVGPLARVLSDQDPAVRAAAAAALGESSDRAATTVLLGHLDDSMPSVREVVVDALAKLGDGSAVVPLIGRIQDSQVGVRRRVAAALGDLGDPRSTSSLLLALQDTDTDVVVEALGSLGKLRSSTGTAAIVSVLEGNEDADVRLAAVRALGKIGSPQGIAALVDALGNPQRGGDQEAVVEALATVGSGAIPRLKQCLVGQPKELRAAGCAQALGRIGGLDAVQPITDALRRGVVRPTVALAALADLGRSESIPVVLEFLVDGDRLVRRAAIAAASRLLDPSRPDGRAVEPIARALGASSISVQERAQLAELLGRTGAPRAVSLLRPLAGNTDDVRLRVAAIRALGSLPPAGQDAVLIEALDAESSSVRWAAAVALRKAASGASTAVLLDRFERRPEQDRVALAVALAGGLLRNQDPSLVVRVGRLAARSRGAERDALIEALGHAPGPAGSRTLVDLLVSSPLLADRAKAAEALERHPEAISSIRVLARDVDGSVRANAVWSLGVVGGRRDISLVEGALHDRDVAVAGNAAAALGRLAHRSGANVTKTLCDALRDSRSYVRANALGGLAIAGERCNDGREGDLLLADPSPMVRRAGARLLHLVSSKANTGGPADRALLDRCAETDRFGTVAAACATEPPAVSTELDAVTVYVVPAGQSSPTPRAPFALVLPDGVMRLGVTDRRGVVHEAAVPRGTVTLAVPAPLAR